MRKIGITGSLASGKTSASKILSHNRGPLFSADKEVLKLYKSKAFKRLISKKFRIKKNQNIKRELKKKITKDRSTINKLEKIIHPLIRREMHNFIKKNSHKRYVFFEIPLLVESKLMKIFDLIFFIKAKKSIRLRRFRASGGDKKLFEILNKKQLSDKKKSAQCHHVVVNEKTLKFLKKRLLDIFRYYERDIS